MPSLEFTNLAAVLAIAFLAPFLLGLAPSLRVPAVVAEIVAGIAVGPSGLGWVEVDAAVQVFATIGLAVLLFLVGLGIELERLRGRLLRLALLGFLTSFGLALSAAAGLAAIGAGEAVLLTTVTLMATSLAVVVPVLKDTGEVGSPLGQAVIAGSTASVFGAVVLLSLLFSGEATGPGTRLLLFGLFVASLVVVGLIVTEAEHWQRLTEELQRLEDTSAQIRVRGAFLLLIAFVVLGQRLGVEVVLGAFLAGVMVGVVDRDRLMTHPHFRVKLDGIGYGIFVPVFFVASGLRFDLDTLLDQPSATAKVPLFLLALILARGVPAAVYWPLVGTRRTIGAALLQATSLPFIVAATQIGVASGQLGSGTAAAFVAAGLISVVLFPALALALLSRENASASDVPVVATPGQ